MAKFKLPSNVTRAICKVGLQLKKHSPEILMVAGAVGTVASTVMACKATLKVNEITSEANQNIERIHTATENGVTEAGEVYTPEDSKKDLTIVYVQTGLKFVKLYAPAVALGALSLTGMLASNNILRKRTAALAAAYATVDQGFKDYRGRVIDRFGKELDRELKLGLKAKEVEETVINEDGTESVVKKTVNVVDPNTIHSEFTRCFDETCTGWTKDAEFNKMFLHRIQDMANRKLQEQGYLYLNEVHDMLGMTKTRAGQEVGWVYDKDGLGAGDNYVDFNIYSDIHDEAKRDFVNGHERSVWVDFNVDGYILDLMQ